MGERAAALIGRTIAPAWLSVQRRRLSAFVEAYVPGWSRACGRAYRASWRLPNRVADKGWWGRCGSLLLWLAILYAHTGVAFVAIALCLRAAGNRATGDGGPHSPRTSYGRCTPKSPRGSRPPAQALCIGISSQTTCWSIPRVAPSRSRTSGLPRWWMLQPGRTRSRAAAHTRTWGPRCSTRAASSAASIRYHVCVQYRHHVQEVPAKSRIPPALHHLVHHPHAEHHAEWCPHGDGNSPVLVGFHERFDGGDSLRLARKP